MNNYENLIIELEKIKERNNRVESDKAWEGSYTRKFLIMVLTYFVVVSFFYYMNLGNPWVNAIVPSLGFILSTLSLPLFKKLWIQYLYKR